MSPTTALVVEDDSSISQFVRAGLGACGIAARSATSLASAREELARSRPDLLILDLGLPDGDGVDLVRQLRTQDLTLPILILSARSEEAQKIQALDAGADDYLTKPFSVGELLARARAMLRRSRTGPAQSPTVKVGALEIDTDTGQAQLRGQRVKLSARELALMRALARAQGKVATHRQLLTEVWGADQVDQLQYLRIYVGHLRAKLEDDPAEPKLLLTELGVGYRLADD